MSRVSGSSSGPATEAFVITPDDDNDLATETRGIYIGGAGDLTVDMGDNGTNITFVGLMAGVLYPFCVQKVYATGTTATGIVGVY